MLIGLASTSPRVGKTTAALALKKELDFLYMEMSEPVSMLAKKFFGFNGDKSDPNQRRILPLQSAMPRIWKLRLWHPSFLKLRCV